jgi:predicted DNA-binding transcriptional regulator AlpA
MASKKRILSYRDLATEKGIRGCRRHIMNQVRAGKFPPPRQISEARIGWLEDEIDEWLENRPIWNAAAPAV